MMDLFVYGTLRRGGFIHNQYESLPNNPTRQEGRVKGWKMYSYMESYPVIVPSDDDWWVVGETYSFEADTSTIGTILSTVPSDISGLIRMELGAGYTLTTTPEFDTEQEPTERDVFLFGYDRNIRGGTQFRRIPSGDWFSERDVPINRKGWSSH